MLRILRDLVRRDAFQLRRPPYARRALTLALTFALGSLACGEATREPPPSQLPAALTAGGIEVAGAGPSRYRVHAREAERLEVLEALAREAGFTPVPGRGRPVPKAVTLALEEVSLEAAIAAILEGFPYHLHYQTRSGGTGGVVPETGADAIALRRVTVGGLPDPAATTRRRARFQERVEREKLHREDPDPEALAARIRERELREAERQAEIESRADSADPRDRARAASLMRPDEDLEALLVYLDDPDADVRAAAAESLADVGGGEPGFAAAESLLRALGDEESAVVAMAVRALEDIHDELPDPRIRDAVYALAEHEAPEVRDAVESFRDWVED